MRLFAKASAGSTRGDGSGHRLFAGASADFEGRPARSLTSVRLILAGCLAISASLLGLGVSFASAASPVVTIDPVANVGYTSVEVSGEVGAEGPFALYFFEYSTDDANWTRFDGFEGFTESSTLAPTGPVLITGLKPSTHYSVRLSADNFTDPEAFSPGPDPEFTTLGPVPAPAVTIDPVTTFTDTTARLSGTIDPGAANGDHAFDVHWHFVCEPACSSLTEGGEGEFADDGDLHEVHADAVVEPNAPYTIKLVAENAGGSGSDETPFHTLAPAPAVETMPAFALGGGTEALIGGKVNPKNQPTRYWLEYGPGAGGPGATYPISIPTDHNAGPDVGSGSQFVFGTEKITGLVPASTYHFRISAANATDVSHGEDVEFKTLVPPIGPPAACPNDKLRSETDSQELGECRAYEMVTPPDKNGGDATASAGISADGNRVGYYSASAFGEPKSNGTANSYLSQRTPAGWVDQALQPELPVPNLSSNGGFALAEFTPDLTKAIFSTRSGAASEGNIRNLFLAEAGGASIWVTSPTMGGLISDKVYVGRSSDGSHVVFESSQNFTAQGDGSTQVWEWVDGQVRLVSVLPESEGGGPSPEGAVAGSGVNGTDWLGSIGNFIGGLQQPTVVSEDGSRIFFGLGTTGISHGVYVREDGTRTRRLDLSQRADDDGEPAREASFVGASADGSIAFLTSPDQLTDNANIGGGLYAYHLQDEDLVFIPGFSKPDGSLVGSISQISEDGSHVYFVAPTVPISGKGVLGGDNLYVADEVGIHFIATLNEEDGQVWAAHFHDGSKISAQATPDGRYLVFPSFERLTSYDNDGHREIYLYDADDGSTVCVSCDDRESPASGDASIIVLPVARGALAAAPQIGRSDAISPDGSRVLFETTQGLVPSDVNGQEDVYLYEDGRPSLVSTGTGRYDSEVAGMTPDGRSVFFTTRDSLVGQDIDGGAKDIYDARVEGGFPAPPVANPCDSQSACQGTPGPAPDFGSPATTASARGNPPPPRKEKHKSCKGNAMKHGKCGHKKIKRHRAKKHRKHGSKSGRGQ